MIIPIVVPSVRYTATGSGAVVRDETCEKCGQEYVYLLRARVAAQSRLSADRSKAGAMAMLEKELKTSSRPAPCPACGWVQKDAIVRIKRKRSILPAVALTTLLIVPLFGWEIAALSHTPSPPWLGVVASVALALCSFWLWRIWSRDYNEDPTSKLRLPLIDRYGATKKAEFKGGASIVGPTVLEVTSDNWVRVDRDRLVIPAGKCCACAGEAEEGLGVWQLVRAYGQVPGNGPQRVGYVPWNFPMCQACFNSAKSNRWRWASKRMLAFILIGTVGASYFAWSIRDVAPKSDKACIGIVGICLCLMVALFGALISAARSVYVAGPVQFNRVDLFKGTGWLRCSSPQYIQLLQNESNAGAMK